MKKSKELNIRDEIEKTLHDSFMYDTTNREIANKICMVLIKKLDKTWCVEYAEAYDYLYSILKY